MREVILLKLGEVMLKGLNRSAFEGVLVKTVKRRMAAFGDFDIYCMQSTIYVEPKNETADIFGALDACGRIFGVVGFTKAAAVEKDLKVIQEAAAQYLKDELENAVSFKVEARRSDKKFAYKSPDICSEVGHTILERYKNLTVDVHNPQITVRVEIREKYAYIHAGSLPGAGGIPVGTGGKAAIMISGGLDSPVAAWYMAKRGISLTAIHFSSPPYTSELAHQKVVDLLERVGEYAGRIKLITVELTRLQEQIRDRCPGELNTVILRRYMVKAAQEIALGEGCAALITGESLGQVASQTLQAIACTDEVADIPVLRPLIGMDKAEIIKVAYKIDTFDLSTLPYEDCCTIFTPKHPKTKPALKLVKAAEEKIDEELLRQAIKNIKTQIV